MINIIQQKYIISFVLTLSFIQNFKTTDILLFNTKIEEDEYFIKNNKYFLRLDIIEKFNSYLKLCQSNELINKSKYPLLKFPKISVIIPLYNGGKYLNNSLRSIQNQNLKEIEIIIIDDFSTDDSLNYVEKFMQDEPRIRLIKNFRNRKILYSKSIAALNSNGEYILELDQDDMFIRGDLFDILYKESKKYNLDLVQFRDFIKDDFFFKRRTRINFNKFHWIPQKQTFYMEESELKASLFKDRNNYLLWGLLIKTEIYKKAVKNIWDFIINYKYIYNEDYISTTMICILAHNYKYLNTFGLIHLKHKNSTSYNCFKDIEFHLSNILFPNYLNDYFVKKNPEYIHLILNYLKLFKSFQVKASHFFPKFLEFNLRNLLYNNYLLQDSKQTILKLFNIDNNQSKLISSFDHIMNSSEYYSILDFQNKIIKESSKNKDDTHNIINNKKTINQIFQYIYINDSNFKFDINKIIKLKLKRNKKHNKNISTLKISIIIYCNELKFLEETLISIINQKNFFSIEIIIIYDNFDKIELSDNFMYNNIHIINNFKIKGIMHSFITAILASKGQYILCLKSGYTLTQKNTLPNLYNLLNNEKIDILEFNLLVNKDNIINESSLNLYKCHHFNSSFDTNIIKYNKNYKEIDQEKELLINKLIRTEIYKRIIHEYKLGEYKNSLFNNYDDIIMFLLKKNEYTFKYTNIFGLIKNINYVNSLKLNKLANNIQQKTSDLIFYINFLFDHSENDYKDKKMVYDEYINILSIISNKLPHKSKIAFNLLKKFMKCKYINYIEKQELSFYYASLIN